MGERREFMLVVDAGDGMVYEAVNREQEHMVLSGGVEVAPRAGAVVPEPIEEAHGGRDRIVRAARRESRRLAARDAVEKRIRSVITDFMELFGVDDRDLYFDAVRLALAAVRAGDAGSVLRKYTARALAAASVMVAAKARMTPFTANRMDIVRWIAESISDGICRNEKCKIETAKSMLGRAVLAVSRHASPSALARGDVMSIISAMAKETGEPHKAMMSAMRVYEAAVRIVGTHTAAKAAACLTARLMGVSCVRLAKATGYSYRSVSKALRKLLDTNGGDLIVYVR